MSDQDRFHGQRAVVTGGASGLGFGIAAQLAAEGAAVSLWDCDRAALATAAQQIQNAHAVAVDVVDPGAVEAAAARTFQELGGIEILVTSAGISGMNAPLWEYPIAEWNRVIQINLTGLFHCARSVIPFMLKNNYGRIVNIASIAGKEGNPNAAAYSASKAGVIALTKSLGKELADTGIRVNCLTPAAVRTPIFEQLSPSHIDFMLSKIPLKRFGTIAEIAAMACWVASKECSFTTGAVFDLSGGRATY
jgi:2-dehydro-3-deoxy-L-rhamnonate dehydrogenase (NAD+)